MSDSTEYVQYIKGGWCTCNSESKHIAAVRLNDLYPVVVYVTYHQISLVSVG